MTIRSWMALAVAGAVVLAWSGTVAASGDRDGDGVADAADRCPDDPEDKDAFEDEDGCPDPDNDRDRIPDVDDKCPNQPEVYDSVLDTDGCPDRIIVPVVDPAPIEPIYFAVGSAVVGRPSRPMVDVVVLLLKEHPEVTRVEIAGHIERGERRGLDLRRAQAVRRLMIAAGIDGARLEVKGYGATRPRDPGRTRLARARNRRVELSILERASP